MLVECIYIKQRVVCTEYNEIDNAHNIQVYYEYESDTSLMNMVRTILITLPEVKLHFTSISKSM